MCVVAAWLLAASNMSSTFEPNKGNRLAVRQRLPTSFSTCITNIDPSMYTRRGLMCTFNREIHAKCFCTAMTLKYFTHTHTPKDVMANWTHKTFLIVRHLFSITRWSSIQNGKFVGFFSHRNYIASTLSIVINVISHSTAKWCKSSCLNRLNAIFHTN